MAFPFQSESQTRPIGSPPQSLWADAAARLLSDRAAVLGLVIIAFFTFVAVFAPLLAPHDPREMGYAEVAFLPPAWVQHSPLGKVGQPEYPLGTDAEGRDLLSRLIHGTRASMFVGLAATPLVALVGTLIGLLAGYAGGRLDNALMRVADVLYAFPSLMFYILILLIFRFSVIGKWASGLIVLFLALILISWVGLARLVRAAVLSIKEAEYVEAARALGASHARIVLLHILPNCLGVIVTWMAFAVPRMIVAEAVLGYLGIGLNRVVDDSQSFFVTSWGGLFLNGRMAVNAHPIILLAPTVCVALVGIAFTFLGDGLRDAFDPRFRSAVRVSPFVRGLVIIAARMLKFLRPDPATVLARRARHVLNPVSPLTYYRRHMRETLLLVALVGAMTAGVGVMVRLLNTLPESSRTAANYLTRVSLVSATGPSLDPGVVAQIRAQPGVAHALREKGLPLAMPALGGESHLFGIAEADLPILLDACGLRLKEGRLLLPRTNELLLTVELAKAMRLQLGDQIVRSLGEEALGGNVYEAIPSPLILVGLLESASTSAPGLRLGIVSFEYVSSHELFEPPWAPGLVVIPQAGRQTEVNQFLESETDPVRANVMTQGRLLAETNRVAAFLYSIFGVVDVLVAVVMALVVGVIYQIAQRKRVEEFGVLCALGHGQGRLTRRVALEAMGMTAIGWGVGLALAWLIFAFLKAGVYEPRGLALDLADVTPIWFSLPIPLATVAVMAASTWRTLARLDAVSIVERGRLEADAGRIHAGRIHAGRAQRSAKRSLLNPLSARTFYQRHRRRGVLLLATMAAMILGVSFPAFLFAPMGDALPAFAEPLRRVGIVQPRMGGAVDPGTAAQIRSHASVARVIPAIELSLRIDLPPMGWMLSLYGVPENDLQALAALYGAQIGEGRWPRPRTNEIVLSQSVAQNRRLRVGDKIGRPVSRQDRAIPTELVVVGILTGGENDLWTGFASYEYLSSHELYASAPVSLIVIPHEGQKDALDNWLRRRVHSAKAEALTFEWMQSNYRALASYLISQFGLVEMVIAVAAAAALAVLSYTFHAERQDEWGILHAIGYSRAWLVWRVVRETAYVVAVAWLVSVLVCGAALVVAQAAIYAPKGLSVNLINPMPWLFTLPIPLAVIAASAGLVARMLSRLDPVSIVERR